MIKQFLQSSCHMILKISTILYDAWFKTANTISDLCILWHFNFNWLCFNKCFFKSFSRTKTGDFHKYLNFHSLKSYTTDYYKEALKQVDFRKFCTKKLQKFYSGLFESLCERCPYSEFFWSVFSRIWTECGPENSEYGHFSRSGFLSEINNSYWQNHSL